MSKRTSRTVAVFKARGITWLHRTYRRNGETRHCYAPRRGYAPVFSRTPLTPEQFNAALDQQDAMLAARTQEPKP